SLMSVRCTSTCTVHRLRSARAGAVLLVAALGQDATALEDGFTRASGDDGRVPGGSLAPVSAGPVVTATSSVDQEAADRAAVEQAYRQFWLVTWSVDREHPESDWRRVVATVAVGPAVGGGGGGGGGAGAEGVVGGWRAG